MGQQVCVCNRRVAGGGRPLASIGAGALLGQLLRRSPFSHRVPDRCASRTPSFPLHWDARKRPRAVADPCPHRGKCLSPLAVAAAKRWRRTISPPRARCPDGALRFQRRPQQVFPKRQGVSASRLLCQATHRAPAVRIDLAAQVGDPKEPSSRVCHAARFGHVASPQEVALPQQTLRGGCGSGVVGGGNHQLVPDR